MTYSYITCALPSCACAIQLASAASLGKNFACSPNCSSATAASRCTTSRTVTATLGDGTERVIYREGQFVLD